MRSMKPRLTLATHLAADIDGAALFLLDEPTRGLHADDVQKLLRVQADHDDEAAAAQREASETRRTLRDMQRALDEIRQENSLLRTDVDAARSELAAMKQETQDWAKAIKDDVTKLQTTSPGRKAASS